MSTETIALYIAGVVWSFLYQLLGKFGLEGKPAQFVAVAVSFVIAAGVELNWGHGLTLEGLMTSGATVAALALVVYRQLIKQDA